MGSQEGFEGFTPAVVDLTVKSINRESQDDAEARLVRNMAEGIPLTDDHIRYIIIGLDMESLLPTELEACNQNELRSLFEQLVSTDLIRDFKEKETARKSAIKRIVALANSAA